MAWVAVRDQVTYPNRWGAVTGLYTSGAGSAIGGIAGTTLSAAGDVLHFTGRIRWDDGGTHTVAKIWFRTGTVTNTNGVDLRVGFQTPTGTNPRIGDGTFDSYGDINSPISSDTTYGAVITGGPTLADMDEIVVTIDGLNDTTPDSIAIGTHNTDPTVQTAGVTKNTTRVVRLPTVLFESTDGTPHYGVFQSSQMWNENVTNTNSFNSGTTYDEYGCQFLMPFAAKVDRIYWYGRTASAVASIRIYEAGSTTPLASRDTGTDMAFATTTNGVCILQLGSEVTLAAGTSYIVSIKATETTPVYYAELLHGTTIHATGNHTSALPGGTSHRFVYRSGTGSWNVDNPTHSLFAGVMISALDDGAGGSGGGIITHPGMTGGMRG